MKNLHRVLLPFLLLGLACAQGAKPSPSAKMDQLVKDRAAADPLLRTQVDVELSAQQIAPNTLQVTLTNKTARPLLVGPKFFAVIHPGEKTVIPANPESVKLFPVSELAPGDQVSGELSFPPQAVASGGRLVFKHPECRAAMTGIK